LEVNEEMHCLIDNGSTGRVNLIKINNLNKEAFIIDLTIRMKRNEKQAAEIDIGKRETYTYFNRLFLACLWPTNTKYLNYSFTF